MYCVFSFENSYVSAADFIIAKIPYFSQQLFPHFTLFISRFSFVRYYSHMLKEANDI